MCFKYQHFILSFLFSVPIIAQTNFQKLYGDTVAEEGFSICKSKHDNSYVYTGRWQMDASNTRMLITKVNQFGDTLWTKTVTNAGASLGRCIIQTKDSGYAVVGAADIATNENALLIKLDKFGEVLWSRVFDNSSNSDYGRSIIEDAIGNLYMSGYTVPGLTCPFILKLTKYGNIKWSKVYKSAYNRMAESINLAPDGSLIVAGTTDDSLTISTDPLIFKVDTANGNFIWAKMHIGNLGSAFYSVITNTNSEIVTAGGTQDYNSGSALRSAVFSKFDLNGNILQFRSYSDCSFSTIIGYHLIQSANAGYAMTGFAMPCPLTSLNNFLLQLDASGNLQSNSLFGSSTSTTAGWEMLQENDGGYVIVGSENNLSSSPVNTDASIIRTTPAGITSCNTFSSTITTSVFTPTFFATSFTYTNTTVASMFSPLFTTSVNITTQCITVGLDPKGKSHNLEIMSSWPNPFIDHFVVDLPIEEIRRMTLCDITGREIAINKQGTKNSTSVSFNGKALDSGVYFLNVKLNTGHILTTKLICTGDY